MSVFSTGKYAIAICDRCGQQYNFHQLRKEWNGLMTCPECWEPKHPQLVTKNNRSGDPQALPWARPARTETPVPVMLDLDPLTVTQGSSVINVFEDSHGRTTGDVVRFRDGLGGFGIIASNINYDLGYTIAVVDDNNYTFTVNTDVATGNGTIGGGSISVGPIVVQP